MHSTFFRMELEYDTLAEQIVNALPEELFQSSTTTFLDSAFAGGQFIVPLARRLNKYGHKIDNIRSRIFGYESNRIYLNYPSNKKLHYVSSLSIKSYEDFLNEDTDMNFDVVLGNPPYNSDDTSRSDTQHRGQGDNLAKKFVLKSLNILKQNGHMVMIMPYGHRTYSKALAEEYRKAGLYKIDNVMDSFKQVSTNPCAFYFDTSHTVEEVEDNFKIHQRTIPQSNIGSIFRNQPGRLNRVDYEHKLTDTGKYRIVVTTAIQKYTDDSSIIEGMNDTTRGNWRVVMNCTTSKGKFGRLLVESPNSILSKSVHCLICDSEEQAHRLKNYLESDEVVSILNEVKLNACNSKKFLEYISLP